MKKTKITKPNISLEDVGKLFVSGKEVWRLLKVTPEPVATFERVDASGNITDIISKFKRFVRLEPVSPLPKPPRKTRSDKGKVKKNLDVVGGNKANAQTSTRDLNVGEQASTQVSGVSGDLNKQAADQLAAQVRHIKEGR